MKGKKDKKKTPSPPVKKVEEEEPKEEPIIGIDAQMLTMSNPNLLNPNQILGTKDTTDNLFIPDDASSIAEDERAVAKKRGVLTREIISVALSNIGPSACGTMHVFLNLSLPGYGLQDITALLSYVHLQKVDLSFNNLEDLSPLSGMKFLIELNVSHNLLNSLLDFTPPLGLREADFSYNQIEVMPDLSAYDHLVKLHLDHNDIVTIDGISDCKSLHVLTLSHNQIERIENVENLKLRVLSLSHNQLTEIENVETLNELQEFDLSGNNIFNLNGLTSKHHINALNVANNQISDLADIQSIEGIKSLRILNLIGNPIGQVDDYRKNVIFSMQQLSELDEQVVGVEEKVRAINLFNPPEEVQAALDHITHTVYRFLQPSKIYESTLPSVGMPYPMLVLAGPQACGKRELAHRLAQEFPDYFGFGISHTTRVPYPGEQDGKDYHFVTPDHFQSLIRQGCFIQTFKHAGCLYGLTLDAIESVAKEGLACVVHMEINGIRTLKNTYFEPRYVLIIPTSEETHRSRMVERGVYSKEQMDFIATKQSEKYKEINQNHPGFFDMVINNNKLAEAYDRLRQLVMDYLGTTELTPGDADAVQPRLSTTEHKDETSTHHTTLSANMRRTWSRPSYHGESSTTNDPTSAHNRHKLDSRKTPVEEASFKRRQDAAKEAIEGLSPSVYDELFRRPMVPMTAPGMLEGSPMAQASSMYQDPSFAAAIFPNLNITRTEEMNVHQVKRGSNESKTHSSSPDSSSASLVPSSGLSGLSSARGFSDQESRRGEATKKETMLVAGVHEQPLDLSALSDALESLKGSLKDSSRTTTPLAPRASQEVNNWLGNDNGNGTQNDEILTGANVKPVLPPIPTGGR